MKYDIKEVAAEGGGGVDRFQMNTQDSRVQQVKSWLIYVGDIDDKKNQHKSLPHHSRLFIRHNIPARTTLNPKSATIQF